MINDAMLTGLVIVGSGFAAAFAGVAACHWVAQRRRDRRLQRLMDRLNGVREW